VLIASDPHGDFSVLVTLFFLATPFAVAITMAAVSVLYRNAPWRQGADAVRQWREDNGGFWGTNLKSTGFMFLGLFGSFACEVVLRIAFSSVASGLSGSTARYALWFALFPFAAYAPVILLLFKRRNDSDQIGKAIAKTIGVGNLRQTLEIAKRGPEAAALVGQALEDHFRERAAGYRQAAQMMREEEEREEADAKMKRELEAELLRRIDAQIARTGDETANN
jgi:hypothetical protein